MFSTSGSGEQRPDQVSVNSPQMVATRTRVNKTCFLSQRMNCPDLTSNPGSCKGTQRKMKLSLKNGGGGKVKIEGLH